MSKLVDDLVKAALHPKINAFFGHPATNKVMEAIEHAHHAVIPAGIVGGVVGAARAPEGHRIEGATRGVGIGAFTGLGGTLAGHGAYHAMGSVFNKFPHMPSAARIATGLGAVGAAGAGGAYGSFKGTQAMAGKPSWEDTATKMADGGSPPSPQFIPQLPQAPQPTPMTPPAPPAPPMVTTANQPQKPQAVSKASAPPMGNSKVASTGVDDLVKKAVGGPWSGKSWGAAGTYSIPSYPADAGTKARKLTAIRSSAFDRSIRARAPHNIQEGLKSVTGKEPVPAAKRKPPMTKKSAGMDALVKKANELQSMYAAPHHSVPGLGLHGYNLMHPNPMSEQELQGRHHQQLQQIESMAGQMDPKNGRPIPPAEIERRRNSLNATTNRALQSMRMSKSSSSGMDDLVKKAYDYPFQQGMNPYGFPQGAYNNSFMNNQYFRAQNTPIPGQGMLMAPWLAHQGLGGMGPYQHMYQHPTAPYANQSLQGMRTPNRGMPGMPPYGYPGFNNRQMMPPPGYGGGYGGRMGSPFAVSPYSMGGMPPPLPYGGGFGGISPVFGGNDSARSIADDARRRRGEEESRVTELSRQSDRGIPGGITREQLEQAQARAREAARATSYTSMWRTGNNSSEEYKDPITGQAFQFGSSWLPGSGHTLNTDAWNRFQNAHQDLVNLHKRWTDQQTALTPQVTRGTQAAQRAVGDEDSTRNDMLEERRQNVARSRRQQDMQEEMMRGQHQQMLQNQQMHTQAMGQYYGVQPQGQGQPNQPNNMGMPPLPTYNQGGQGGGSGSPLGGPPGQSGGNLAGRPPGGPGLAPSASQGPLKASLVDDLISKLVKEAKPLPRPTPKPSAASKALHGLGKAVAVPAATTAIGGLAGGMTGAMSSPYEYSPEAIGRGVLRGSAIGLAGGLGISGGRLAGKMAPGAVRIGGMNATPAIGATVGGLGAGSAAGLAVHSMNRLAPWETGAIPLMEQLDSSIRPKIPAPNFSGGRMGHKSASVNELLQEVLREKV